MVGLDLAFWLWDLLRPVPATCPVLAEEATHSVHRRGPEIDRGWRHGGTARISRDRHGLRVERRSHRRDPKTTVGAPGDSASDPIVLAKSPLRVVG